MSSENKIWYIHINKAPNGPYTENEIWDKLKNKEINYNTYIWRKTYKAWKKIEDESTFDQQSDDVPPPLNVDSENIEPSIWYLNDGTERSGPFTHTEVIEKIKKGVVTESHYIWKKKMKEWVFANKMTEFKEFFESGPEEQQAPTPQKTPPPTPSKPKPSIEHRRHDRVPLLARVIAHDNQDVQYMPCANISVGGIFLYTDKNLWKIGTVLKLNIRSDELPESFNAEGEVVDYCPTHVQQGYRIKFVNIPEKYQKMIEELVKKKLL